MKAYNNVGGVGIAYDASLVGYNYLEAQLQQTFLNHLVEIYPPLRMSLMEVLDQVIVAAKQPITSHQ